MLSNELIDVKTLPGWTLIGEITEYNCNSDSSMLVIFLFTKNEKMRDLWE